MALRGHVPVFFYSIHADKDGQMFSWTQKKMCASEAKSQEVMKVDGCALSEI